VSEKHVLVSDWHTPADLQPASFDNALITTTSTPTLDNDPPKFGEAQETQNDVSGDVPSDMPRNGTSLLDSGMLEKVLPLIGKINNGGLDMPSVLELLDKSGQGFGALGKLLPLVAPLLQNGLKKKPTEDIVDLKTINLDN